VPRPQIHVNTDGTVRLEGWNTWVRQQKQIDEELGKAMVRTNRSAARMVVDVAQQNATSRGGITAKAGRALTVAASQGKAVVRLTPSTRVPYAFGAEFGAKHDIPRDVKSWWEGKSTQPGRDGETGIVGWNSLPQWRGNQWIDPSGDNFGGPAAGTGYFLSPAVRTTAPKVVELYADTVTEVAERNGFSDL